MFTNQLAKCLERTSLIPTDVNFMFKEENIEVKAHSVILALASDVFEVEFFGSMKEEKTIRITDVSHEVFQNMINYIYNRQPKWKDLETSTMCSLYYLGDKYNIGGLRDDIITNISEIEITRENVLKVATLAEENCHHQPLSESLYGVTAAFLKAEFRGKLDRASDFCLEAETSEIEFNPLAVLKIMARLNSGGLPEKCENCQQVECQDGEGVTRDNFIPGARIKAYPGGVSGAFVLIKVNNDSDRFTAMTIINTTVLYCECSFNPDLYKYKCVS